MSNSTPSVMVIMDRALDWRTAPRALANGRDVNARTEESMIQAKTRKKTVFMTKVCDCVVLTGMIRVTLVRLATIADLSR